MLCWGSAKNGQLGLGGIEEELIPTPVHAKHFDKASKLKQIACGYNHTLFLLENGLVYSCGNNDFEQLGHEGARTRPEQVMPLEAQCILSVAAGHSFSLALNNKGQLFCWGAISGRRDDEYFYPKPTLIRKPSEAAAVQVSCGYYFFLMLTEDGKVYVMGLNDYGQLGLGNNVSAPSPVYLISLQGIPVMQIASGAYHTLILTVSGNIFAFGRNDFGQLGFGDTEHRLYPMNLKFLNQLKACYISCGENFTAVLTLDGGVFTFGACMYGQLGHNTTTHEYLPRKVLDLMGSEVTQIACGRCHMLVYVMSSQRLYSFGLGGNGQLGLGAGSNTMNRSTPTLVHTDLVNTKYDPKENKIDEAFTLYSISSGGDQSFVIYHPQSDNLLPVDFRKNNQNQILTVEKYLSATTTTQTSDDQKALVVAFKSHVQTLFASASCLNASFLDNDRHYDTSNRYPGVDLAKAKTIQTFLLNLKDTYLNELIVDRLTKLFQSLPESPPSIEAIRLYVTMPFLTEFEKMKPNEHNIHSLLFAYAQSINKLKKEAAGRVLDYWFAWTGVEFFKKLINAYKNMVVHIINLKEVAIDTELVQRHNLLKSSMVFLQKLHKINLEFREIVPYDTFYVPELVEKVDIKKDYYEWLRRKNLRLKRPHNYLPSDNVLFCDFPFVFDGRSKTLLLQTDADIQMQVALQEAWAQNINSIFLPTIDPVNPLLTLFVRRDHIVQDTLNQLSKQKRDDLKKPLKVMFIGEDAYDAGGVKKEFFMLLLKEILDLKYGMFTYYEETHTIWFNDQTLEGSDMYHLIGELCGLAIYNSTIIDLPFPLGLYKKLLKEPPTIQDMHSLSPITAQSLESMTKYDGDDFESVFNLTFEITRQRFDQTINVELIPNGTKTPVTKENCKQYVNAYIDYIFNKSVELPFSAFNTGFHHVCGSKVLELFHPVELQSMVIGNENYDFNELEKNTEYKGDYNPEHPVIKRFWKVFHEMDLPDKKKFLIFLTGTDRIPILGMKRVKIIIQSTNGGDAYFPVAHTCFNLLDLPQYTTETILKEKLLTAIEYKSGFTIV